METIVCKHEVHQVHQEADSLRYELAMSLIRSLMSDISEANTQIFQETKLDMPSSEFFHGAGCLDAYGKIWGKLRQWEIMLCQQAGIPVPSVEEEIAECC